MLSRTPSASQDLVVATDESRAAIEIKRARLFFNSYALGAITAGTVGALYWFILLTFYRGPLVNLWFSLLDAPPL